MNESESFSTFFLEPFDAASWLLVGLAAVQISAFSIFLFEWLSPAGYDMKVSSGGQYYRIRLRSFSKKALACYRIMFCLLSLLLLKQHR